MVAVHYPAMLVTDPHTGLPLTEVRGEQGSVVERGTDTLVTLTEDAEGEVPLPNPITVSPEGFTPPFYVQSGLARVDFISGPWRTPLWSPVGLEAAAAAAAQAAQDAAQAAQVAASLVGAPVDAAVAALLASPDTATYAAVVDIASQHGGGGSGDAQAEDLYAVRRRADSGEGVWEAADRGDYAGILWIGAGPPSSEKEARDVWINPTAQEVV